MGAVQPSFFSLSAMSRKCLSMQHSSAARPFSHIFLISLRLTFVLPVVSFQGVWKMVPHRGDRLIAG